MVSFQCEGCGDTVKKPKLAQHSSQCHAPVTCIDCMTTFYGRDFQSHTSCMTEDQKYQGHLYREKPNKASKRKSVSILEPADTNALVPVKAYVEDEVPPAVPTPPPAVPDNRVRDSVFDYLVEDENQETPRITYTDSGGEMSMKNDAPSVFSSRPNSRANYRNAEEQLRSESYSQHGFSYGAEPVNPRPPVINASSVSLDFMTPAAKAAKSKLSHPESASHSRQNSNSEKKRKRAQTDEHLADAKMADAPETIVRNVVDHPNIAHSGLTGGLQRMLTDDNFRYPDSPQSSPDPQRRTTKLKPVRDPTKSKHHHEDPQSPLKRTRRSKEDENGLGISIKGRAGRVMSMINDTFNPAATEGTLVKTSRRRGSSSDQNGSQTRGRDGERRDRKKHKVSRHNGTSRDNVRMEHTTRKSRRHGRDSDESRSPDVSRHRKQKAIEYHKKDSSSDSEDDRRKDGKAMVVFGAEEKQRKKCETFLSYVTKGPGSEKGYSINKTLKRWHRDNDIKSSTTKHDEEKELWKGLRLKRNDRGEIVVFFKYEE